MAFSRLGRVLVTQSSVLEAAVREEAAHASRGCGDPSDRDSWVAAWSDALTAMELDVERVERVLAEVHRGAELPSAAELLGKRWEAPKDLGPLPHPLLPRAQKLLLRQQQVAGEVAATAAQTRRHVQATASMRDRVPAQAVYLDLAL